MFPTFALRIAAGSASLRGVFARYRWLHWGITSRLSMAFLAVALLAATVNLIVERGVTIVRTSQLEREPASQRAAAAATPRADATEQARNRRLLALNRALARSAADAPGRLAGDGAVTPEQYRSTLRALDGAMAEVQRAFPAASLPPALPAQLSRYRTDANEVLALTITRQRIVQEYSGHYDALVTRLQASLSAAFRLFGRVLARQDVLQLHADLDAVGRAFASVRAAGPAEAQAFSTLIAAESAFTRNFQSNASHLKRSEGAAWVDGMQRDLLQLQAQSDALLELDQRYRTLASQLPQEETALTGALTGLAAPQPVKAAGMPPSTGVHAAAGPEPTIATVTTTTQTMRNPRERALIAWITSLVLLVLLVICVLTIRSIVLPVRRLLKATALLASGQSDVRVPRGGIKELDTLAIAFNHMAGQIAATRTLANEYQRQLEEKVEQRTRELQHLAEHDPLTLLPNRRQLLALLNEAIAGAERHSYHVGVFFVDVDNFKNINDSMGHGFGDQVLRGIAHRLQAFAARFGFAARWGGDEFTVVQRQASTPFAIQDCGRQLVEAFHEPFNVAGHELVVTVSVGASVYPDNESCAEDLLSASDAALFRAKALGRNRLALFAPELLVSATNRFTVEQSLRRALEREEFELHYQPELNLETMTIDLVEALVRWRQPDGRLALPDEFLGVAEDCGLILNLGDWVVHEAIKTAAAWHHGAWPGIRVAINVSPRQLLHRSFVARVQALLRDFRLPPDCIELELTESVLQNGPGIIDSMRELQSRGIAIALDDFGTGFSSLASLEHLPLSRVKLDKTLIGSIDSSSRSSAIAAAIIDLCADLGLQLTAEGIERAPQIARLLRHGRMHLQGYLISHALLSGSLLATREAVSARMRELVLSIRRDDGAHESPAHDEILQHSRAARAQRGR